MIFIMLVYLPSWKFAVVRPPLDPFLTRRAKDRKHRGCVLMRSLLVVLLEEGEVSRYHDK